MVSEEAAKESPKDQKTEGLFSPGFKSVAAMAGWDEESILIASLIVEDTPDRTFGNQKKRSADPKFRSPSSTHSRRKRRALRRSPVSVAVPILNLDEEGEPSRQDSEAKKAKPEASASGKKKTRGDESKQERISDASYSNSVLPCIEKLREELSCAICLEICFEPSTTPCGHSFCKKCLRSAADKCGKKCPKCRQLVSNGRSCALNTVLWNTIQLLFPQEVEARKAAGALNNREKERQISETRISTNARRCSIYTSTRRRGMLGQDEDFELAQRSQRGVMIVQDQDLMLVERLQREEFSRLLGRDTSVKRREMLDQDEDLPLSERLSRRATGGSRTRTLEQVEDLPLAQRLQMREANGRRRRETPNQDQDAAIALRLQREEFMEAFRGNNRQSTSSLSLARANLRALASRANTRSRGH